jgi:uncharacterized protein (DUF302 family)
MSESINFKREMKMNVEEAVERITVSLKTEGFGILTRIDLHEKIKEKIGKDLKPTVILGACNPHLAYEAFLMNSDIASLLPCNAVVRDLGNGSVSIELAKPSAMMKSLGNSELVAMAAPADEAMKRALDTL